MAIVKGTRRPIVRRNVGSLRPRWPYCVNKDSWQSESLLAWYSFPPFSRTIDKARDLASPGIYDIAKVGVPTIVSDPEMGHAADFTQATPDYFKSAVSAVVDVPFCICAWVLSVDNASAQTVFSLVNGQNDWYRMLFAAHADDKLVADQKESSPTTQATARSPNALSINEWHHCVCVFAADDDRRVYLDGQKATNGTTVNTPSPGTTGIGTIALSSPSQHWDGLIAELRLYGRAPSDAEVSALGNPSTRWDLSHPLGRKSYFAAPAGGALTGTAIAAVYVYAPPKATATLVHRVTAKTATYVYSPPKAGAKLAHKATATTAVIVYTPAKQTAKLVHKVTANAAVFVYNPPKATAVLVHKVTAKTAVYVYTPPKATARLVHKATATTATYVYNPPLASASLITAGQRTARTAVYVYSPAKATARLRHAVTAKTAVYVYAPAKASATIPGAFTAAADVWFVPDSTNDWVVPKSTGDWNVPKSTDDWDLN